MRVEIEREAPTKRWRVWVLNDLGGAVQVMASDGTWLDHPRGTAPPPTWVIEDEIWRPLTAAILRLPPESAPLADALTDARVVRDRLLSLVEQAFPLNLIAPRDES